MSDYITNHCRTCGGGIEFPQHGIGERIECPHCGRPIVLIEQWEDVLRSQKLECIVNQCRVIAKSGQRSQINQVIYPLGLLLAVVVGVCMVGQLWSSDEGGALALMVGGIVGCWFASSKLHDKFSEEQALEREMQIHETKRLCAFVIATNSLQPILTEEDSEYARKAHLAALNFYPNC